jgi:hypothetical protein
MLVALEPRQKAFLEVEDSEVQRAGQVASDLRRKEAVVGALELPTAMVVASDLRLKEAEALELPRAMVVALDLRLREFLAEALELQRVVLEAQTAHQEIVVVGKITVLAIVVLVVEMSLRKLMATGLKMRFSAESMTTTGLTEEMGAAG